MSITKKNVEAIEALLPFLFGIRGAGELAAHSAAESLMELLDISAPVAAADAGRQLGNVIIFPKDQGGAC